MRNQDTIEFLALWESLHNPGFKPVEFDGFAILIEQGKSQIERLQLLNKLAIRQLKAIQYINTDTIKKLEGN